MNGQREGSVFVQCTDSGWQQRVGEYVCRTPLGSIGIHQCELYGRAVHLAMQIPEGRIISEKFGNPHFISWSAARAIWWEVDKTEHAEAPSTFSRVLIIYGLPPRSPLVLCQRIFESAYCFFLYFLLFWDAGFSPASLPREAWRPH